MITLNLIHYILNPLKNEVMNNLTRTPHIIL